MTNPDLNMQIASSREPLLAAPSAQLGMEESVDVFLDAPAEIDEVPILSASNVWRRSVLLVHLQVLSPLRFRVHYVESRHHMHSETAVVRTLAPCHKRTSLRSIPLSLLNCSLQRELDRYEPYYGPLEGLWRG